MDHVASGWNGRKSNNILVPDEETNGVSVVGGDLDFLCGQNWLESCQGGTYTRIGSTFEDKRG